MSPFRRPVLFSRDRSTPVDQRICSRPFELHLSRFRHSEKHCRAEASGQWHFPGTRAAKTRLEAFGKFCYLAVSTSLTSRYSPRFSCPITGTASNVLNNV